jgi:membrane protein YqaA with SNARE-associated domain
MKNIDLFLASLWRRLVRIANHPFYPFLSGVVAFLDVFIFVIPVDGLVVASAFAAPKHWLRNGISFAVGSTVGAIIFVTLVREWGEPFIQFLSPTLMQSSLWSQAALWFSKYGLGMVFGVSVLPIAQPPILALSGLSHLPLESIILTVAVGRSLKTIGLSWVTTHTPEWIPKGLHLESKKIQSDQKED